MVGHRQWLRRPNVTQTFVTLRRTKSSERFAFRFRGRVVGDEHVQIRDRLIEHGPKGIHSDCAAIARWNHHDDALYAIRKLPLEGDDQILTTQVMSPAAPRSVVNGILNLQATLRVKRRHIILAKSDRQFGTFT